MAVHPQAWGVGGLFVGEGKWMAQDLQGKRSQAWDQRTADQGTVLGPGLK